MFNPYATFVHAYLLVSAALISPWFLLAGAIILGINILVELAR